MAKIAGPLLSHTASGSLTDALTFSTRKNVNQVRYQRKQRYAPSDEQITRREYFFTAKNWWHELTPTEQMQWEKEM